MECLTFLPYEIVRAYVGPFTYPTLVMNLDSVQFGVILAAITSVRALIIVWA